MTLNDIRKTKVGQLPENASALVAMAGPKRKQNQEPALERNTSPKQASGPCMAVCIIGFRKRLLDDDNFSGANKHLRDQIARSLGVDDGDPRVQWNYRQLSVSGQEGTLVKIDVL